MLLGDPGYLYLGHKLHIGQNSTISTQGPCSVAYNYTHGVSYEYPGPPSQRT